MSFELYNTPFKLGVGVAAALFIAANIISYVQAYQEEMARHAVGIKLSNVERLNWGFPYPWFYDPSGLTVAINLTLLALFGFAVGFAFRTLFTRGD